jgi:hypothetical protein
VTGAFACRACGAGRGRAPPAGPRGPPPARPRPHAPGSRRPSRVPRGRPARLHGRAQPLPPRDVRISHRVAWRRSSAARDVARTACGIEGPTPVADRASPPGATTGCSCRSSARRTRSAE